MFNTKSLIVGLLCAGLASFSFAQATQGGGNVNAVTPAATVGSDHSVAKSKSHKVKPQVKQHKAKPHAVKAKKPRAKGQSKSKGPGLEAY